MFGFQQQTAQQGFAQEQQHINQSQTKKITRRLAGYFFISTFYLTCTKFARTTEICLFFLS